MPRMERHAFAFPGSGDVVDLLRAKLRIFKRIVISNLRQLDRIALTNSQQRSREPSLAAVLHVEQGRLDDAGADIDARGNGHDALPSACPRWARRANSAAPSAPV